MIVRLLLVALVLLVVGVAPSPGEARARPEVRSAIPPFCVLTGGPRGPGSRPQICRFYDYQVCLQAAADLRGNCVVNIDYPYPLTHVPGATWSR